MNDLEVHEEQVSNSVLALPVDEILALAEMATGAIGVVLGFTLGNHHLLPIKLQFSVRFWIC